MPRNKIFSPHTPNSCWNIPRGLHSLNCWTTTWVRELTSRQSTCVKSVFFNRLTYLSFLLLLDNKRSFPQREDLSLRYEPNPLGSWTYSLWESSQYLSILPHSVRTV